MSQVADRYDAATDILYGRTAPRVTPGGIPYDRTREQNIGMDELMTKSEILKDFCIDNDEEYKDWNAGDTVDIFVADLNQAFKVTNIGWSPIYENKPSGKQGFFIGHRTNGIDGEIKVFMPDKFLWSIRDPDNRTIKIGESRKLVSWPEALMRVGTELGYERDY